MVPLLIVLVAAALAGAGCEQSKYGRKLAANTAPKSQLVLASSQNTVTSTAPPLQLEEKSLLLLEEVPAGKLAPGAGADNSRCHVCHLNYAQEILAVCHARANIGCADCHGASDAHIADESWASGGNGTPPDQMYPQPKINPACLTCHPKVKIDIEPHRALLTGAAKEQYCTDCHGTHRLARRKCKWK